MVRFFCCQGSGQMISLLGDRRWILAGLQCRDLSLQFRDLGLEAIGILSPLEGFGFVALPPVIAAVLAFDELLLKRRHIGLERFDLIQPLDDFLGHIRTHSPAMLPHLSGQPSGCIGFYGQVYGQFAIAWANT
jgi:hypothetical protein